MKRMTYLSWVTILFLIGFSLFIPSVGAAGKSFSDYQPGAFGFDEVTYLVEKGVIQGYEDQTFKPNRNINRGQTAVMFQRALGLEDVEGASFIDIPSSSTFANAAAATKAAGIFNGKADGSFGPADLLTREQMASVLVRAFGLQPVESTNVTVPDQDKVSPSHLENVVVLYQNGITTGRANGMFDPKGNVTRAQFSVFMYRALEAQKEEIDPEEEQEPVEEIPEEPPVTEEPPVVEEPPVIDEEEKPETIELEITKTKMSTTDGSVSGDISSSDDEIEITFDLTDISDEATIKAGSITVSADSTLTLTKIPSPISLVVKKGTQQELTEGENSLSLADKIAEMGANFGLVRSFIGDFEVGATIEDEDGNKKDITLIFIVE